MNNRYDYQHIFKLITNAILTRNFYLLDQEKIVLPSVAQLNNFLKKNQNNFTFWVLNVLNNYCSELLEQLNQLKFFMDNNDSLDTAEKVKEYLNLVPFNGTTSDRNYVVILRLCGINVSYNQDYSILISSLLTHTIGGDFYYYLGRIRKYDLVNYSRYKVYDESKIKEYMYTLRFGCNGETLSLECSRILLDEILNYMKNNKLPFSPFMISKLRDTVFKEIVDESVQENLLPYDFEKRIEQINSMNESEVIDVKKLKY